MKKKVIVSLLAFILFFSMTGCGKKSNSSKNQNENNQAVKMPTEEEIRKATVDAPMTDIEKEVLLGEGGIQQNYLIENIRIENGYLIGTITNQGTENKIISLFVLMMNSETGEQYGTVDFVIGDIAAGETKEFVNPVEESVWGATGFNTRVTEITE